MPLGIDKVIDQVEYDLGWPDDAAHRARALAEINNAERYIAMQGSFFYLNATQPLVLAAAAASSPAPSVPAWDYGKSAVIEDDIGTLRFAPRDRFRAAAGGSFYSLRNDRPAVWTIAFDSSVPPALRILFNPGNATAGNLTYTMSYQRVVADLSDSAGSFSLLPDGAERTLLAGRAIAELRRILGRPGWQAKAEELGAQLAVFYDGQRMTREEAKPDSEAQMRKQHDFAEEA